MRATFAVSYILACSLVVVACSKQAAAPPGPNLDFTFSRHSACGKSEHDPYGADEIAVERTRGRLIAAIQTAVNGAATATSPSTRFESNTVTLAVQEQLRDPDVVAACLIAHTERGSLICAKPGLSAARNLW